MSVSKLAPIHALTELPGMLFQGLDGRVYSWDLTAKQFGFAAPGLYLPTPTSAGCLPDVHRDLIKGDYHAKAGELIINKTITGYLIPSGSCTLKNVQFAFAGKSTAAKAVVWNTNANWIITMIDCEVFDSGYDGFTYGVGRMGIQATRCYFHDTIDGIGGFLNAGAAAQSLNMSFTQCLVEKLLVGYSSEHSDHVGHTDCCQVQGHGGVLFNGCALMCRASAASPYAPGNNPTMAKKYQYPNAVGSVIGVTPNTGKIIYPVQCLNSWLGGGLRNVAVIAGDYGVANGIVQLHNNLFYSKDSGLGSDSGDAIVTQNKAWVDESGNYWCDADGNSTGVRVPVKIATATKEKK